MSGPDDFNDVIDALHALHDAELSAAQREPGPARGRARRRLTAPAGTVLAVALSVIALVLVWNFVRLQNVATPTQSPSTASPVAVATNTLTPAPSPSQSPTSEPSPSSALTSAPSPTPTPTPEPAVDLSPGAWVSPRNGFNTGAELHYVLYGRLDGRAFMLTTPTNVSASKPADNGMALAWWLDPIGAETVVVLIDTATGSPSELLRTALGISSAELSRAGDEWYWIQSGSSNELWRQSLPDGTPGKVADLRSGEYTLELSADGSKVVIRDNTPNGNSDCPSGQYRVWDSENGAFERLPTNVEELVVGVIGDSVFIEGWCSAIGLHEINLGDGSRTQVASDDAVTAGVYALHDGSSAIVYSGIEADQHEALFEYAPGDAAPRLLYVTGRDVPESGDSQILVGNHDFGGITFKGWAPFLPFLSQYLAGNLPEDAGGVPSQLVNLDDGTIVTLPPLNTPQEVSLLSGIPSSLATALHRTPYLTQAEDGGWLVGLFDRQPVPLATESDARLFAAGPLIVMVTPGSENMRVSIVDPYTLGVRDIGAFPLSDEITVRADPEGRTVYVQGSTYALPGVDNGVIAFDVATGTSRTLLEPGPIAEDLTFRSGMALSPSGTTLASSLCSQTACHVDLINVDDGQVRTLNTSLAVVALTDEVALIGTGGDEGFRVMLYDLGPDTVRQVADISPAQVMQVEGTYAIDDGHFIVSQTSAGRYDIFEVEAATGAVRSIYVQIGAFEEPDLTLASQRLLSDRWILVQATSGDFQVLDRRDGSLVTTLTSFHE